MLLVKCPECARSYRLSEELYRRKAAGYGVVITCRHCKTQIHVDEGAVPSDAAEDAEQPISDAQERSVAAGRKPERETVDEEPEPETEELRTQPEAGGGTALRALETPRAPTPALPAVAPRAGAPRPAPRPAGVPRPHAGATATPMPLGSATRTPLPVTDGTATVPLATTTTTVSTANATASHGSASTSPGTTTARAGAAAPNTTSAGAATTTPLPAGAATPLRAPRPQKARMVALSPGLLGVSAAVREPAAAGGEDDSEGDSTPLLSVPDAELFAIDSEPVSEAPDSAMPISSVDYLSSIPAPPGAATYGLPQDPEAPTADPPAVDAKAHEKRLPHAPPVRRFPAHADATPAEDLPSSSGIPKVEELAHAMPMPLKQRKGEAKRRRLSSGDLTDDLLSADIGFDGPSAIAPPDADALLRAPLSSRPAAAPSLTARATTRAPVTAATKPPEKQSSGRGVLLLLIAAAFGTVGFFLRDRLAGLASPEAKQPSSAVHAEMTAEPAPPPAAEAPSTPSEAAPAEGESSATPPAAGTAEAVAKAPEPSEPAPAAAVAQAVTPRHHETSEPAPPPEPSSDENAATDKQASTSVTPPAATPAVIEQRSDSAGTDPFDVAAARTALASSAAQASSCRKAGDPSGVAVVTITFSQTGRVTTANVSGPPFQATSTGGCIASTMRRTRVPPFAGDMVTVRKTITIE